MASRKTVSRWNRLTGEMMAEAIFKVVKGNCALLEEDHIPETSIWGTVLQHIGPQFNGRVDRFYIRCAFRDNKLRVADIHYNLCNSAQEAYIPPLNLSTSCVVSTEVFCICQQPETVRGKLFEDMIQCSECEDWWHAVCMNILLSSFKGNKKWLCKRCRADTTICSDKIPNLFKRNYRNRHHQDKTVSHSSSDVQVPIPSTSTPNKTANSDLNISLPSSIRSKSTESAGNTRKVYVNKRKGLGKFMSPRLSSESNRSPPKKKPNTLRPPSLKTESFKRKLHFNSSEDRKYGKDRTESEDEASEQNINLDTNSPQSGTDESDEDNSLDLTSTVTKAKFPTSMYQMQSPDKVSSTITPRKVRYDLSQIETTATQEANTSVASSPKIHTTTNTSPMTPRKERYERRQAESKSREASPMTPRKERYDRRQKETARPGWDGPTTDIMPFIITLTPQVWKVIKPQENKTNTQDRYKYRLKPLTWTDEFALSFMRGGTSETKGCKLKFNKHLVKMESADKFVTADALCKRNFEGVGCTMKYDFIIRGKPKSGPVEINVIPQGTLLHDLTKSSQRYLQGQKKQEAMVKLKTIKPSILLRQNYSDPNLITGALDKNQKSQVHSLKTFQRARKQVLRKDDLSKDVILDLVMQKMEMEKFSHLIGNPVSGYIQSLSVFPFVISLYTNTQMHLLRRLLKQNPDTTFHLDSTGKVVSKLPSSYEGKRLFYYALVVTLEKKEAPVVPLLEFISNNQGTVEITHVLHAFFQRFREFSSTTKPCFGIRRVMTDNSMALISAVMQSLEVGAVHTYLKMAWTALCERSAIIYVHHLCRRHVCEFIKKEIKKEFGKQPETLNMLQNWMYAWVANKDLYSFCRRVTDVVLICGKQYLTDDVKRTIDNLDSPTARTGIQPWSTITSREIPTSPPLYGQSPFSYWAINKCRLEGIRLTDVIQNVQRNNPEFKRNLESGNQNANEEEYITKENTDRSESGGVKNPHFNINFIFYLIRNVFPISCLMDQSLPNLNSMTSRPDTNAASEAWNKILKKDEQIKPMRVSRFVRRQEDMLKGRLQMFHHGLQSVETQTSRTKTIVSEHVSRQKSKTSRPAQQSHSQPHSSRDTATSQHGKRMSKSYSLSPVRHPSKGTAKKSTSGIPRKLTISTKKSNRSSTSLIGDEIPESQEEQWSRRGQQPRSGIEQTPLHILNRIPYGGYITYEGERIMVMNTCNIDSQMMIVYALYKLDQASHDFIHSHAQILTACCKNLISMFQAMEIEDWSRAKELVVINLLQLPVPIILSGNLFESEEGFLSSLSDILEVEQIITCPNKCHVHGTTRANPIGGLRIRKPDMLPTILNTSIIDECVGCFLPKPNSTTQFQWGREGAPPFFFYPLAHDAEVECTTEDQIPRQQIILNQNYNVFAYTIFFRDHFTTVFIYNRTRYIYDGLRVQHLLPFTPAPKGHRVSTIWLVRD